MTRIFNYFYPMCNDYFYVAYIWSMIVYARKLFKINEHQKHWFDFQRFMSDCPTGAMSSASNQS